MSPSRKPTNGKGAHKGRAKPWIPSKFQDEAAQLLNASRDPWKDERRPPVKPDWENPRQFWSTVLAYLHWRENGAMPQTHYHRPVAKSFWEALKSCAALAPVWSHRRVEEVHALVLALDTVHRRGLNSRNRTPASPAPPPGAIRKRERWDWRWWAKWLEETEAGFREIDNRLIGAEACQRLLEVIGPAKAQAATWAKTPPQQEIRYHIYAVRPDGSWGITNTVLMKSHTRTRKGRPDGNDLPEAINGELAMLDTFARPVFGRPNYPKTLAAIVQHFLPSDDSLAASYSDSLRVRIHRIRRTRTDYVAGLENGVRSALQRLKEDPLTSELA